MSSLPPLILQHVVLSLSKVYLKPANSSQTTRDGHDDDDGHDDSHDDNDGHDDGHDDNDNRAHDNDPATQ